MLYELENNHEDVMMIMVYGSHSFGLCHGRHYAACLTCMSSLRPHNSCEVDTVIIPIVQIRRLRVTNVKNLLQSHPLVGSRAGPVCVYLLSPFLSFTGIIQVVRTSTQSIPCSSYPIRLSGSSLCLV